MLFERSNTAIASGIQKFPMRPQLRFLLDGELPLECPERALESDMALLFRSIIAREVHVDGPQGQRPVGLADRAHRVGANQHVADACLVLKVFEMVRLVSQSCPRSTAAFLIHKSEDPARFEALDKTNLQIRNYLQSVPTIYLPSHDPESAHRLATRNAARPVNA